MKTLLSLFLLLALGASAATGIKISEYPNTPVLTNSELFIVAVTNVTPATNRNITYGQLRSLLSSNNFVGSFTGDGRNVSNVVAASASSWTANPFIVFDDFKRSNTASGSLGVATSGQTWDLRERSIGGPTLPLATHGRILDNRFITDGGVTVYATQSLSNNVTRIGARISWSAGNGGTEHGVATLAICADAGFVTNMAVHLTLTPASWILWVRDTNGFDAIDNGVFSPNLLTNETVYPVEVMLSGDTVNMNIAGFLRTFRNTRIAAQVGPFCFWELSYNNTNSYSEFARFESVWAGSSLIGNTFGNVTTKPGTDFVGINMVNPAYPLDVYGTAMQISDIYYYNGLFGKGNYTFVGGGPGDFAIRADLGSIAFGLVGYEKMRLWTNGCFGIGTTNPPERLTVSGNISASGAVIATNGVVAAGGYFTGDGRNVSNVVAVAVSGTLSNNISENAATATLSTNAGIASILGGFLSTNIWVIGLGDSITAGTVTGGTNYLSLLTNSPPWNAVHYTNFAVSGQRLGSEAPANNTTNTWATQVAPWIATLPASDIKIVSLLIGANDFTQSYWSPWSNWIPTWQALAAQIKSSNCLFAAGTIMPRGDDVQYFTFSRIAMNTAIYNSPNVDWIFDVSSLLPDNYDTNGTSATYADDTHPSLLGQQKIANLWSSVVLGPRHNFSTPNYILGPRFQYFNQPNGSNIFSINSSTAFLPSSRISGYLNVSGPITNAHAYQHFGYGADTWHRFDSMSSGALESFELNQNGSGLLLRVEGNNYPIWSSGYTPGDCLIQFPWNFYIGSGSRIISIKSGSSNVGIGTDTNAAPERLTVIGNISASGAVIATNAFVMPPVATGPDWCTNGLAAIWNSNTTVYIRTSAVGATTFADKLMAP